MIVLSESSDQLPPSASARDIAASTNAAKLVGCAVFHIPADYSVCENAEGALWHVPEQAQLTPAIWIGYIPSLDRYSEI